MSGKASPADPTKIIKPEDGVNGNGDDEHTPGEEPIVKFSPEEEAVRQLEFPPAWSFI